VVFDYSLKFSGLKIPFPWLPQIKFEFTGIPIALSPLLYGFPSGVATVIVAFLGMVVRGGSWVSAFVKAIAEFTTVVGMAAGLRLSSRWRREASLLIGVIFRIAIMSVVNLIVYPRYYGLPYDVIVKMLPLIGVFNAIQGTVNILGGYFLYEAFVRRIPHLASSVARTQNND
jgi:riboflavin transporter FmnP